MRRRRRCARAGGEPARVRASAEAWLRAWWAGEGEAAGRALSAAALPAELAFRAAVALRRSAYDRGLLPAHRAAVPVICVGNLTVGGTGKTPLAGWVAGTLAVAGARPMLVLRGYGRDEALLHRRWRPEIPVVACADRVHAVRRAAAAGASVVVLDDGYQHRRLARDLDLVVVSADQLFPGRMLPRGPYREPVEAIERASWVVVTRKRASAEQAQLVEDAVRRAAPAARLARAVFSPAGWTALDGGPAAAPGGAVLAVAGIADPPSFAALVRGRTTGPVELLAFADHHNYTAADVERIRRVAQGRTIAVTEKDAVKLSALAAALPDVRVLELRVEMETGEAALRTALLHVAGASAPVPNGKGTP
ncbi:MAG: tetraacyldisaccharide 4'-kinase [Gemmatimonadetes bacterium]|nr:tetraacyldisaccharide 4'-kinase [Gemmatimonadota bacterium]